MMTSAKQSLFITTFLLLSSLSTVNAYDPNRSSDVVRELQKDILNKKRENILARYDQFNNAKFYIKDHRIRFKGNRAAANKQDVKIAKAALHHMLDAGFDIRNGTKLLLDEESDRFVVTAQNVKSIRPTFEQRFENGKILVSCSSPVLVKVYMKKGNLKLISLYI